MVGFGCSRPMFMLRGEVYRFLNMTEFTNKKVHNNFASLTLCGNDSLPHRWNMMPTAFQIKIKGLKLLSAGLKTGVLYNCSFFKFLSSHTIEAAEPLLILLWDPHTSWDKHLPLVHQNP
jgi:hypothetical protein